MNKKNKCKKYSSAFSGFLTYFITGSSLIWLYYADYYVFQLDKKYVFPIIITFSNLSSLIVKFLNKYSNIKTYITFSYSFLLISHLLIFLSIGQNKLKKKLIEIFALILYGISVGIIQFPILKNCQMYFQTKSQLISFICYLFYNFRLFFFFIVQLILNKNKQNQESIMKTYIISYLILFCITLNTSFDYRNEYLTEEKKTNLKNYIPAFEGSYSNRNINSNYSSFGLSNRTIEVSFLDEQKSSGNSSSELSDKIKSVLVYNELIFNKTEIIFSIFLTINFWLIIILNALIFYNTFYCINIIDKTNKAKFLLFICFERIIFSFCINLIHIKLAYLIIVTIIFILRYLGGNKLLLTLFSSIIFSLQSVSISPLILKIYGIDVSHIIASMVIFITVLSAWIEIVINLFYKEYYFKKVDDIKKVIDGGFLVISLLIIYGIRFDFFDYGEIIKKNKNNKERQNDIELTEVSCDKK